jgi:hypothetical protein
VFPNGEGKPDGHFLRKLNAIAKKAGVEGALRRLGATKPGSGAMILCKPRREMSNLGSPGT